MVPTSFRSGRYEGPSSGPSRTKDLLTALDLDLEEGTVGFILILYYSLGSGDDAAASTANLIMLKISGATPVMLKACTQRLFEALS